MLFAKSFWLSTSWYDYISHHLKRLSMSLWLALAKIVRAGVSWNISGQSFESLYAVPHIFFSLPWWSQKHVTRWGLYQPGIPSDYRAQSSQLIHKHLVWGRHKPSRIWACLLPQKTLAHPDRHSSKAIEKSGSQWEFGVRVPGGRPLSRY